MIIDIGNTADGRIELSRLNWSGELLSSLIWSHPDSIAFNASALLVHPSGDYIFAAMEAEDFVPQWAIVRMSGDGQLVWWRGRAQILGDNQSIIQGQFDSQNDIFWWSEGENLFGVPALETIRMSSITGNEEWVRISPMDLSLGASNPGVQAIDTSALIIWVQDVWIQGLPSNEVIFNQWDTSGELNWNFVWSLPKNHKTIMEARPNGNLLIAAQDTNPLPPRPILVREFDQQKLSCQEPIEAVGNGRLVSILPIELEGWLVLYSAFKAGEGELIGLRKVSTNCALEPVFSNGFEC